MHEPAEDGKTINCSVLLCLDDVLPRMPLGQDAEPGSRARKACVHQDRGSSFLVAGHICGRSQPAGGDADHTVCGSTSSRTERHRANDCGLTHLDAGKTVAPADTTANRRIVGPIVQVSDGG